VNASALTRTVSVPDFVSLVKPRLSALVLATAIGGMWAGRIGASLGQALFAVVGISGVIGAGNALNCYLERDSDRLMSRTRNRPLPTGRMESSVALTFGLSLAVASLTLLAVTVNVLTAGLAVLALVSYVGWYTPLKSRSPWAMWVGCLPGALPPLMGWTAVRGRVEIPGLILFAILFLWQVPHFLAIALYRKPEYRAAGLTSIPLAYGDRAARIQAAGAALLLWPVSLLMHPPGASGFFYLGVANTLGALFCALTVRGWLRGEGPRWARQLFFASLVYLPFLFLALALTGGAT
jgi:protoheme IX farnesyltransferase